MGLLVGARGENVLSLPALKTQGKGIQGPEPTAGRSGWLSCESGSVLSARWDSSNMIVQKPVQSQGATFPLVQSERLQ